MSGKLIGFFLEFSGNCCEKLLYFPPGRGGLGGMGLRGEGLEVLDDFKNFNSWFVNSQIVNSSRITHDFLWDGANSCRMVQNYANLCFMERDSVEWCGVMLNYPALW